MKKYLFVFIGLFIIGMIIAVTLNREKPGSTNSVTLVVYFQGKITHVENADKKAEVEVLAYDSNLENYLTKYNEQYLNNKTWTIIWKKDDLFCEVGKTYVFTALNDNFWYDPVSVDEITEIGLWRKLYPNLKIE